jgi:leader peptidase (prepilin peptidase)/N-methyltransferase
MNDAGFLVAIFVLGACIGSFLNVCITRWPAKMSVVKPRSRCPVCERPITWYENIPMLSWLVLRGRCRGCATPISSLYPIVELATGVLWTATFMEFGPTFTGLRIAIFGTILLGVAITDARDYIIPDGFTITGFLWNFAAAVIAFILGEQMYFAAPGEALLGACVGAGSIAIVAWLGEAALRKEAMGFGDVTLMAMAGSALGPERSLITVFVGAFLGAVVFLLVVYPIAWMRARASRTPFEPPLVPFGVFLAPASMVVLLWGEELKEWWSAFTAAPGM